MIGALLSRRRRGAVAIMAIAAMIPTTAMFSANINTAQITAERRQTQDAADAAAALHATWTARSLNVISANNVTTAQLLTLAVGSEALEGTLAELEITAWAVIGGISIHAGKHCTKGPKLWIAACVANHAWVSKRAIDALTYVSRTRKRYDPKHGIDVANKALKAIDGMNRAIVDRFPRAMAELGAEYARVHGIDDVHFADPCLGSGTKGCRKRNSTDGMSLPVEDGGATARAQMVGLMMTGTTIGATGFASRGFPRGKGPMRYGGSRSQPDLMKYINRTTGIGAELQGFQRYYNRSWVGLLEINFPPWKRYKKAVGINLVPPQKRNSNSFTMRYMSKYGSILPGLTGCSLPVLPQLCAKLPTFWKLMDVPVLSVQRLSRPDDMSDAYRILAYARRDKGTRLSDTVLTSQVESHFGYAQAGVFNPDWADLYSPNWQFRLMPATRLDDPRAAGRKLRQQAPSSFGDLAKAFSNVSDTAGWGRLDAH